MKSDIRRRRIISALQTGFGGGGGSPAYIPTDFANLKYWYDISQLTGLSNGEIIIDITDLSGRGIDLTRGAVGVEGIYTTNFHNGLPAMAMDGTKVYIPDGGKAEWDWMHQGSSTIFWLVQSSLDNADNILFESGPIASASNVGRTIRFRTTSPGSNPGGFTDLARASGGSQIFSNTLPNENTAPKDEILLIVSRYEVGVKHELFINNVLVREVAQNNAPTVTTSTLDPRFFGRAASALGRFNGYFLEGFGYNRVLTLEEIQQLVGGYGYGL